MVIKPQNASQGPIWAVVLAILFLLVGLPTSLTGAKAPETKDQSGVTTTDPTSHPCLRATHRQDGAMPKVIRRAVVFEGYEIIPALGTWDKVVGISRYAYDNLLLQQAVPDLARMPSPGSGFEVNMEKLLSLAPDVVLMWSKRPELVEDIEKRGIAVVSIYLESLLDLYGEIRLLGTIFDCKKRAEEVVGYMHELIHPIQKRVADVPANERPKVLFLWGKPTTVSGGRGVCHDLICLAGGINPAQDINRLYAEVSMERIIAWDPDVIVIWGSAHYSAEDILTDPKWQAISAVKNRRIYKSPPGSTWSPRVALLTLTIAKWCYPKLFSDWDFHRIAHKFYIDCYGIPYKGDYDPA